jgi:hypothetical protein
MNQEPPRAKCHNIESSVIDAVDISQDRRGAYVVECPNAVFLQRSAIAYRNNPEFSGILVRVGEQVFNEFAVSGLEYVQWHDQPRYQNGVEGEERQCGGHMGSVN